MVVYYYEANCQAGKKKNWFTIVNVMVTARANIVKYDYFYYIFQTAGPFATKRDLIVQHYKPVSCGKKWITAFKVKVTPKVKNVSEYLSG